MKLFKNGKRYEDKDFHLAIGGGARFSKMLKKWNRARFYFLCNYSYTVSFLVKILLVKLKNFYIQRTWILTMRNPNSDQKCEG